MPTTTSSPVALTLSETDRSRLQTVVHRGHTSARTRTRAQVLLKLAEGWSAAEVEAAFDVCRNTVKRVRARFLEGGVDAVLTDQVQERRRQALTGTQQSHAVPSVPSGGGVGVSSGRPLLSPATVPCVRSDARDIRTMAHNL